MIAQTSRGIAAFVNAPEETLVAMREATPRAGTALMALVAATLVMVVIDLSYGPLAFPHTLEPGGKRSFPYMTLAVIDVVRALGIAATLWLGSRMVLRTRTTVAEAIWMAVPFAVALILFELLQVACWLLLLAARLNIYGPMVVIGFGAAFLVLVVSVRALSPDRDWLSVLPVAVAAFVLGYYFPYFVLPVAGLYLLTLRVRKRG